MQGKLDWLRQQWIRIALSLIMVGSGVIMLYTIPWTQWAKVGFVGLLIVAIASWWVDWPKEKEDEGA